MKRNFLIAMAGLALVFAMAFLGCTAPISDISLEKTDTPPSLPGPKNVTARVYDGVILLTWDPVPDATGYQIFRKDNKDNISTAIEVESGEYKIGTKGTLYYRDVATFDGNLIDGHSYTYTVYSLSGLEPETNTTSGFIGNGHTSSNSVNAKIPERSVVDWITVGDISIEPLVDPLYKSQSNFLVSWDAKPNLQYEVRYSSGKGTAIGEINGVPILPKINYYDGYTGYSPLNPRASVKIPITGGENTVSVVASFIGDRTYYSKIAVATKTETLAKAGLSAPSGLGAIRNETTVTLRWNKVAGADSYEVYKAPYNEATLEVTGDWTKVTLNAPPAYVFNSWIASELGVSKEAYYYYIVIATKTDGTKSYASNVALLTKENIKVTGLRVETVGAGTSATVYWNRLPDDANVTYSLFRAPITFNKVEDSIEDYNFDTDIETVGSLSSVTVNKSDFDSIRGKAIDTNIPATNTYYLYQLVTRKGNLEDTAQTVLYEQGAYCKWSRFYLEANAADYHNAVALTLDNFYDYDSGNVPGVDKVELYRQTGSSLEWAPVKTFTKSAAPQTYIDTGLTSGTNYRYKIEVKDAANAIISGWENGYYQGGNYPSSVYVNDVGSATFNYPYLDASGYGAVTATSIRLQFYGYNLGGREVKIQISDNSNFNDPFLFTKNDAAITVRYNYGSTEFNYTLEGLTPSTPYWIRVYRSPSDITPIGNVIINVSTTTP
jgi:hypothetical protein